MISTCCGADIFRNLIFANFWILSIRVASLFAKNVTQTPYFPARPVLPERWM